MSDLAEICAKCKANNEKRINNLLLGFEEREKDFLREIEELKNRLAANPEPDKDKLIDLIAPSIEWKEQYSPNGKFKEIIELYRLIRPKETKK